MRTHPMRDLGLMAAGTLGENRPAQRIVRAAHRSAAFGMASFWIRHGDWYSTQMFQRRPTIVYRFRMAGTIFQIPVLSTYRTDPFAIIVTNALHWQRQQNIFAEDVLQLNPVALIKSHLGFTLVDGDLFAVSFSHRPIVQLEIGIERAQRKFQ